MFERKVMAAIARSVALVKCILCAPEGEVDRPGGLARIEAESLEADWVSHASVEISLHVREVFRDRGRGLLGPENELFVVKFSRIILIISSNSFALFTPLRR